MELMFAFFDDQADERGVEPICLVLSIAPFTYYAHSACAADPARRSAPR
jgi:putative transposase